MRLVAVLPVVWASVSQDRGVLREQTAGTFVLLREPQLKHEVVADATRESLASKSAHDLVIGVAAGEKPLSGGSLAQLAGILVGI
jgi:hypothetical protein